MGLPKLGFAKRLLALYTLIFILAILLTDWSLSRSVEKRELDTLQQSLTRQATLIATSLGPLLAEGPPYQDKIRHFAPGTHPRITIVDPQGKVLADTSEDTEGLARMDNHAARPEIAAALANKTGVNIRYSMTLRTKMLYVAVPILDASGSHGALRLAMPVTRVNAILAEARKPVFGAALLGILIVLVSGLFFARRITARIRRITSVAERYAAEDWSEKVLIDGQDELKMLGDTMNKMAASLRHRIRALESEKGKLGAILTHMTDAVIAIDHKKSVVMANPPAEDLFGINSGSVDGKSLIEATRHPYLEEIVNRAFEKRGTESGEVQLSGKTKRILKVSVVSTGKGVRDIGGILVFHDITEIRRLENIRKEFVANVSHELRTPLTSLRGFIETLRDGAAEDAATRGHFLQMMQEDIVRLTRLVEDILTLGEIEQGILPLKKETCDLAAELRLVVERLGSQIVLKKIVVHNALPESPLRVSGDRDKVRQVFMNLVDNAIKFTPPEGKITLKAGKESGGVRVTIEDTGPGIPQDAVPRVFERFFRVDKARSRDVGGTGLGLAIVKHIMEAHGGNAFCQSEENKGSAFSVLFPGTL
ncbi:MAG: cell wall metabolism sensor histidine kinase WalK [Candidatus Omnitrophica bacterium]|nr:cell wall metabolism sensor histidine kinase WalK [Candidatus Omnitrophota bacterium]